MPTEAQIKLNEDLKNAVWKKDFSTIQQLFEPAEAGAEIPEINDTTDQYGRSALGIAVIMNSAIIVSYLLKHGADPAFGKYQTAESATSIAWREGKLDVLQCFIPSDNIDRVISDGENLFFQAVRNKNNAMILHLASLGAEVNGYNDQGDTPLIVACKAGDKERVQLLLSQQANPNIKSKEGKPAIFYVPTKAQHKELITLLLARGANQEDLITETRTLNDCIILWGEDLFSVELNFAEIDLNKLIYDKTPLMKYVEEDNIKMLTKVLAEQQDLDKTNSKGCSAIHYVKSCEALQLLKDAGANLRLHNAERKTALWYVPTEELARLLINEGCAFDHIPTSVNFFGTSGATFLFRCQYEGWTILASELLEQDQFTPRVINEIVEFGASQIHNFLGYIAQRSFEHKDRLLRAVLNAGGKATEDFDRHCMGNLNENQVAMIRHREHAVGFAGTIIFLWEKGYLDADMEINAIAIDTLIKIIDNKCHQVMVQLASSIAIKMLFKSDYRERDLSVQATSSEMDQCRSEVTSIVKKHSFLILKIAKTLDLNKPTTDYIEPFEPVLIEEQLQTLQKSFRAEAEVEHGASISPF
ncbi:ankyrin repeat domain-containing protein [Legionella quateirensis]|uniref:Ankyrin repeat protein n=1 Tax=Legionella quateirensis TaxID=45072 RepID=A0A378KUS3_9GAMM|nr:ankyrin repeat domain-containing protein [Legionella quateirensis]KTD48325.1 Ankyrin repeat protein [Legionella quateirensis]STY18345.1 Ankyrin repeat protein [Legionella quateirensis]